MGGEAVARRSVVVWKWAGLLLLPAAFALSVWPATAPERAGSPTVARGGKTRSGYSFEIVSRGLPTAFPSLTPTNTATGTPTNTPTSTATNTPTQTPTTTATATTVVLPPIPAIPTVSRIGGALLAVLLVGLAVLQLVRTRR